MIVIIFILGLIEGIFMNTMTKSISLGIMGKLEYNNLSNHYITEILVILLSGILLVISFLRFGFNSKLLQALFLDSILVIVSIIDIKFRVIPNKIIVFILVVGIIFSFIDNISIGNAVVGMLVGGGTLFLIAIIPGAMGGGDIKLMFSLGLFLGYKKVLLSLYLAFVMAAIIGIILIILKIKKRKEHIPFGPFLAVGSFISFHFYDIILNFL